MSAPGRKRNSAQNRVPEARPDAKRLDFSLIPDEPVLDPLDDDACERGVRTERGDGVTVGLGNWEHESGSLLKSVRTQGILWATPMTEEDPRHGPWITRVSFPTCSSV